MGKDVKKKPKVIILNKDGTPYKPDFSKMMTKPTKKMSGGMAAGGGHKNYKMTGKVGQAKYGKMMKAKTGKLVGGQKNLPDGLKKAILA
jgi:hypothetical protein